MRSSAISFPPDQRDRHRHLISSAFRSHAGRAPLHQWIPAGSVVQIAFGSLPAGLR